MKLDYVTDEFALTILEAAIARNSRAVSNKELKDVVASAVQICIDADRAVKDYLTAKECPCRTRQDQSQGL